MRIIEKSGAQVRSLTLAEEELLAGFSAGTLSGPRLLQANQLLMKVRGANQWLACDCRKDALPVLNVTLNGNTGTLFLRNNPDTPEHATGCPFTKDPREAGEHSDEITQPAAWLAPDTPCACSATTDVPMTAKRPLPLANRVSAVSSSACCPCC